MKIILKEGKIDLLGPTKHGGALSGEVHLIKHNNKKYIVRKCNTLSKAKKYVELTKKFEKYQFLPKLLGRQGKNVLFEFIEGRELDVDESPKVFEQIGRIAACINKVKIRGRYDSRFFRQLNELVNGKFEYNPKVLIKRGRIKNWKKPKAFYSKEKAREIRKLYNYLKKKSKPRFVLDSNDITMSNFIMKNKKVYFVDIEAIKPRIKGMGIAKCFLKWAKSPQKQKAFIKGYSKILSAKFLTIYYLDFIYLIFSMQAINYNVNVYQKQDYTKYANIVEKLLEKYENETNSFKKI